tara:strand:- start:95 stop:613 length:519 start_codon:yes stop_codon:yes gene_type:complete
MKLLSLLLTLTLLSCANDMNVKNFETETPKFVLEDYFDGKTKAWGMFHDRFGNLKRSFKVDIKGIIVNDTLTLDEKFVYNDGEKESRIWSIKILGNNRYSGTADDVIGKATGISSGNALNWKYKLNLKVKDSTVAVDFDDWMFLQDDNILMNRAEVKKWGIVLGVVSITFKK